MSDIFAPLREPESVSPPAPQDVRRAGDRLRRRRAGLTVAGAVCATAIVVAGITLMLRDRTGSDSVPQPVDSPSAQAAIPAEFDLADGLSRELTISDADEPGLDICGDTFSLADLSIASEGLRSGDTGDRTIRGLSVYPDAGTAGSVAANIIAEFRACPRFSDGRVLEWTSSIRRTADGDQGWVLARSASGGSGPREQLPEVIQVVRLGASLLVVQQREIHGVTVENLMWGTGVQIAGLLRRQMCLLTEQGCAWRSDPDVLRPDGWGPLRMGMSREEVEETGMTAFRDAGKCTAVDLGPGEGLVSESDQLVSIEVPAGVTTPDGIGLGSSGEKVREVYWFAEKKSGGLMLVRASPTADYEITLAGDRVTGLNLSTVGNDCSG